mgnify:CR=1 FL=1
MSRFADLFNYIDASDEETVKHTEEVLNMDGYNENAKDRDGDGLIQEGTPFERPAPVAPVKATKKRTK